VGPLRQVTTPEDRSHAQTGRKNLDAGREIGNREDEMVECQRRLMKIRRMYQNISATDANSWRAAPT
jgi:hypothetical protein